MIPQAVFMIPPSAFTTKAERRCINVSVINLTGVDSTNKQTI
jgi:hypothetical protein